MEITSNATRRLLALTMALLAGLAVVGSPRAEHTPETNLGLDGPEDFALISRNGFTFHINNLGADPLTGDPILAADPAGLGSKMNSDAWAMGYFLGSLFVGTNRNAGCFTNTDAAEIVGTCPTIGPLGIPTLNDDDRAEIWKCTPHAVNRIDGTCSRVYQSPVHLFTGLPYYIGFRKATTCTTGGVSRLYFSGFGPRGRLVFTQNGTTFSQASITGLNTALTSGDLGYGRSECFNNALWVSPVGTSTDNDIAAPGRAIPLVNFNPSSATSPWRAAGLSGFGNPNNISLFNFEAFNGFLYAGVYNRVTGTEIWKTNGVGCTATSTTCNPVWTQVLKNGAGRPGPPAADGTPKNEGVAFMEVYNNALYIGIGHTSSGQNPPRMEMMAFNQDDTWRLIVGEVRDAAAMAASYPTKFICNNDPDGAGGLDPDPLKCFPESGLGAGFGGNATSVPPFKDGDGSYFWSSAVYPIAPPAPPAPPSCLNVATLDRGQGSSSFGPRGADLWRTCNGTTFTAVTEDAFGLGDGASGIRNLAASPPPDNALYAGTSSRDTNTPEGGVYIFKGTCVPNGPLVADAGVVTKSTAPGRVVFDGLRYIVYDDDAVPNDLVTFTLDGGDSANRYCGHDITEYQWHEGDVSASCGNLLIANAIPTQTVEDLTKGIPDSADPLTQIPVVDIITVSQGPTTYVLGTDYIKTANTVDWSPAAGAEPAQGTTYTVTYAHLAAHTAQHTVIDSPAGVPFTDVQYTLQVKALDSSSVEVSDCAIVNVRKSQNLPPKATITSTDPASVSTGGQRLVTLPDIGGDGVESVNITGKCEETEVGDGVASCAFSAPLPGVTFSNTLCDPIPVLPALASLINCSRTATVAAASRMPVLLTATDNNGNTHVSTLEVTVREPRRDVNVRAVCPGAFLVALPTSSITCTPAVAAEDVPQTVTVRLRNDGDFPATFDVTLGDSVPATIGPPATIQVAALPTCLNQPSSCSTGGTNVAEATFNWTPTEGGSHTLTATATLVGETDTDPADNTKNTVVAVASWNDNPTTAVNDTATTNQSTPVTINVLVNDTDADNATLVVDNVTQPANGSVVNNGNNVTYTPNGTFIGTTTFTYQALDQDPGPLAGVLSPPATVTVTVNPLSGIPAAPTVVTVALAGTRMVQVTWTDNAINETRHELQRCRVNFGSCLFSSVNINVPGVPPGTPSYTNTVSSAGNYRFRLRACNPSGCSAYGTSAFIAVP